MKTKNQKISILLSATVVLMVIFFFSLVAAPLYRISVDVPPELGEAMEGMDIPPELGGVVGEIEDALTETFSGYDVLNAVFQANIPETFGIHYFFNIDILFLCYCIILICAIALAVWAILFLGSSHKKAFIFPIVINAIVCVTAIIISIKNTGLSYLAQSGLSVSTGVYSFFIICAFAFAALIFGLIKADKNTRSAPYLLRAVITINKSSAKAMPVKAKKGIKIAAIVVMVSIFAGGIGAFAGNVNGNTMVAQKINMYIDEMNRDSYQAAVAKKTPYEKIISYKVVESGSNGIFDTNFMDPVLGSGLWRKVVFKSEMKLFRGTEKEFQEIIDMIPPWETELKLSFVNPKREVYYSRIATFFLSRQWVLQESVPKESN